MWLLITVMQPVGPFPWFSKYVFLLQKSPCLAKAFQDSHVDLHGVGGFEGRLAGHQLKPQGHESSRLLCRKTSEGAAIPLAVPRLRPKHISNIKELYAFIKFYYIYITINYR